MAASSAAAPLLDAALTHEKVSSIAEQMASTKDKSKMNDSASSEIRIVQPNEYKAAAACLAEAFAHDPVVRYSIDTPDRKHLSEEARFALHTQSLEYLTYAHCLNGLVLALGDEGRYDCVALWLPPGKNIDDYWTILRSGMWRLSFTLSKEGKERFFNEFLPLLGRSKREVLGGRDAESWYLNYIGTRVGGRGKGYARRLVEYVTKQVRFSLDVCVVLFWVQLELVLNLGTGR
jgi:hypothetical protein